MQIAFFQRPDGNPSGIAQSAIHPILEKDFWKILDDGFDSLDAELPRMNGDTEDELIEVHYGQQTEFNVPSPRRIMETTFNMKVRSRIFRRQVVRAYDKTCAFTGLRSINGRGRAEVQAAHIRPVEADGPDSLNNGIALSRTVHWMFDRGLLSLSNDGEILVSRHINNLDEADRLLVTDRRGRLPANLSDRPHPSYLEWHRSVCFKV